MKLSTPGWAELEQTEGYKKMKYAWMELWTGCIEHINKMEKEGESKDESREKRF